MKKFMSILLSMLMIFSLLNFYVVAKNQDNNEEIIINENSVENLKENYDLDNYSDKYKYLSNIFDNFGIDDKYVQALNNETFEKLVNSEEYGYKNCSSFEITNNNYLSIGSNTRVYDDIELNVLWGRNGNEYTLLGTFEWIDLPLMRLKDIISIDLGGGSIVTGSQYSCLMYTKDNLDYVFEYDSSDENYIGVQSACSFEIDIPSGADALTMLISYSIVRNSTDNTITMQYFHKYLPWLLSISVSYIVGISVSPERIYTQYPLQCGTS